MKEDTATMAIELKALCGFVFLVILLMLQQSSALDFDNRAEFNLSLGEYGSYIIRNSFGFGANLATISLINNTFKCGESCYAIKDITINEDLALIDEVRFYRVFSTGNRVLSSITDYKVLVFLDGRWEEYVLGTTMSSGSYKIKLEGLKRMDLSYDWQIKSNGIWTEEWAMWDGLSAFDEFDDTSVDPDRWNITLIDTTSGGDPSVTESGGFIRVLSYGASIAGQSSSANVTSINLLNYSNFFLIESGITYNNFNSGGNPSRIARLSLGGTILYDWTTFSTGVGNHIGENVSIEVKNESGIISYRNSINGGAFSDWISTSENQNSKLGFYSSTSGAGAGWGGTTTIKGDYVRKASAVLHSPENNTIYAFSPVVFMCSGSASYGGSIENVSLWHNATGIWHRNVTNSLVGYYNTTNFSVVMPETTFIWSCEMCDEDGDCGFAYQNYTLRTDLSSPNITLFSPEQDAIISSSNNEVELNYSATDITLDSCWYNTNENSTNTTFTCNTIQDVSFGSIGEKRINFFANDSGGRVSEDNVTFDLILFSQSTDKNITAEGDMVTYTLIVNMSSIPSFSANLTFNGDSNSASASTQLSNSRVFTYFLDVPEGAGNATGKLATWNWSFQIDGFNFSTDLQNQTVYSVEIDDCTTYGDIILNMTLREENTRNVINASEGSNIELDLAISNPNNPSQNWQFSNTWTDEAEAVVCVPDGLLNNTEYQLDFVAEYGATDRVTEFYYLDNGTLDNTQVLDSLTNKTISLYSLLIADSTTFLFEFLDQDSIEVPNAIAHVYRQYIGEGVFEEVERGKQDNNGETHIHLVEEDVIYFFRVSLEGEVLFTSATYNAKCLSSPCAITLTASTETPQFDTDNWQLFGDGGEYVFFSDETTRTVYINFTTPEPSSINLTVGKQDYTGQITAIGSQTALSTGGTLSVVVPQSAGNVTYYAIVYKDSEFISYDFVDFSTPASAYYGTTGTVMGSLLLVALILMGAAEGILLFVFIIIAFILVAALTLLELGYYAIVGFICAVAILIWKLIKRGRRFEGI